MFSVVAVVVLALAGMAVAETLENDNHICTSEIGCSNLDGTSGNPNDMAECFSASSAPPFSLIQATYIIGSFLPPPDSLSLKVYAWSGSGAPGAVLADIPLTAADRATGPHIITLSPPVSLTAKTFCVGVSGQPVTDGFRILQSTTVTVPGTSWIKAPNCGSPSFTELSNIGFPGNWCITATINAGPPSAASAPSAPVLTPLGLMLLGAVLLGLGAYTLRLRT